MSFSFGTTPAAAPGATGFSFGSTAAAPAAAAAAPAPAFNFGGGAATTTPAGPTSAPTTGTGFSFGQPAATAAAAAPATGLSFGAAAAKPAATTATGFGFGGTPAAAPAAAPAAGGLSFGATSTAATGLGASFGQKPTAGVAPTLNFNAPKTTAAAAPTLSFGAPKTTAAPALNFGTGLTATPAASKPATLGGGFSGFGGAAAAATTSAPTLSFGAPAAATTTASTGFGLGTAATGLGGGLGGLTATSTAAAAAPAPITGLGGTVAAPPAIGLGGVAATSSTAGAAGTSSGAAGLDKKSGSKTVKDTQIPNEIALTVDEFKKVVKEERSVSSEIAHISSKSHEKIQTEITALGGLVKTLSAGLARNRAQMERLRTDAAQELMNVEIAQRTKDTPPALQYENVAPYEYFARLVVGFESQMLHYRRQIEETEHHLQAMASQQTLSPDDIAKAIQKLHATFTNLAGRYQNIHDYVKQQKEAFMLLHRQKYGVNSNPFEKSDRSTSSLVKALPSRIPQNYVGPSPFTGQQDLITLAKASLSVRSQQPQMGPAAAAAPAWGTQSAPAMFNTTGGATGGGGLFNSTTTTGFGTPQGTTGLLGSTMSPFGAASNQSSIFQAGGKRGKP